MEEIIVSSSLDDTKKVADNLASHLFGGEVILLNGDLGAGKTTFTKFLAKSLGIESNVTSPTFTIVKEYVGSKLNLYHIDMYRLEADSDVEYLGTDEMLKDKNAITVIEWNKLTNIKNKTITININTIDETTRKFFIR